MTSTTTMTTTSKMISTVLLFVLNLFTLTSANNSNNTSGYSSSFSNSSSSQSLQLGPINFASYNNYVYRDNLTSAQVVLSANSSERPSRLIVAFPKGNTGILTYFVPNNGSSVGVSTDLDSFSSVQKEDDQTGISGSLTLDNEVRLGVTLIGSIRTVRDYTEGNGLLNEIFNWTLGSFDTGHVELVRRWINGTTTQYLRFEDDGGARFDVTPSSNKTIAPIIKIIPKALSTRENNGNSSTPVNSTASPASMRIKFTTTFNLTTTPAQNPGYSAAEIFLTDLPSNASQALRTVVQGLKEDGGGEYRERVKELSFLTYDQGALAGGWRFLTYFGRDTLLATRLLCPILSSEVIESVLGAVLERIGEDGKVCHEETIGDYASYVNIQEGEPEKGASPVYNYVMLDTDFLLLPTLSHYFLSTPQGQGRASAFLSTRATLGNGTYVELLEKNVRRAVNLSRPFSESAECGDLPRIRDALVGNWRDSGIGLGNGKIPFDVSTALIPGALRSIVALARAGIISSDYQNQTEAASTWETQTDRCFQINVSMATAETRLEEYTRTLNLTQDLLYGEGSLNGSSLGDGMRRTGQNQSGDMTYYALSLREDGTPIEILNSDLGFTLFYNNNASEGILQATVEAMKPYPRGLLTNVGMVVANAAYLDNRTLVTEFTQTAYHGAVVWSWQQALMAAGLAKQIARCGIPANGTVDYQDDYGTSQRPGWCATALLEDLKGAETALWDSIAGSEQAIFTEVYSPLWNNATRKFDIGDLGAISPTGTEGDAVQLWSYAFLAALDPRTGRAVAGGF